MRKWLGNINPNPVAQLMIIGWAFAFMIEGQVALVHQQRLQPNFNGVRF